MGAKSSPSNSVAISGRDGAKLILEIATSGAGHALLAPEMFRAPGGIARVSRHYLQAIAETETTTEVFVVVLNDETISEENLASCNAKQVSATSCNRSKWECARVLWNLTKVPGRHITCTHVHLSPLLWLLKLSGRKLTYDVVVHGIEVWKPLSWLVRRGLTDASRILSVSNYTRRELVERYPQWGIKTLVLPNALDPSFTPSRSDATHNETHAHRILAVSRLAAHDWEKGIDHLIQAMEAVRQDIPDAELIIVGEGADRTRLEALARASSVSDVIHFHGRVDDDALRAEFGRCHIFALPSRKEGFGLVYLEAMAAGKPCIVANAGGAPEVINHDSGLVVSYGDVTLLAQTLIEALRHNWQSAKIRARAEVFSFPNFVRQWRNLSRPKS